MMVCNVVLQEQNVDVLMRIRSVNQSVRLVSWWCTYYPPFLSSLFSLLLSPYLLRSSLSLHFPSLFSPHLPSFPTPPFFSSYCTLPLPLSLCPLSLSSSFPLPVFSLSFSSLSPSLLLLDAVWKGMKWFCTGQKMAHSTPSHSGS